MSKASKPLEGVRVIDCGQIVASPLAAMYMGDFGAEVIKVEHPKYGDGIRTWGEFDEPLSWKWIGRNKKSVTIDLHEEDGQELFKELVEDTDILIEGFRPGKMEEWNLGWDTLSGVNPDLIMVRSTGFGQTGPYSHRPGFGTLAEAMSLFAHITGQEDGPPTLPPIPIADSYAAMHSTFAAMFALYWRDVGGGTGQYIDTSLIEPLFGIIGDQAVEYSVKGKIRRRHGNRSFNSSPRNTYRTKDDRWVAIAGANENTARRILQIAGGDELVEDPRFETMADRIENDEELDEIIEEWTTQYTLEELTEIFLEENITGAPIYNIEDIFNDPHYQARDAVIEVDDDEFGSVSMPGVFPKLSETPGEVQHPGVRLGEHTAEVLSEYTSVSEDELNELHERGIINIGQLTTSEQP